MNISNRVSCSVEKKNFLAFSGVQWKLCVASGSIKGQRGDWLVEKATELGAFSFQPLLTDHSPRIGGGGGGGKSQSRRRAKRRGTALGDEAEGDAGGGSGSGSGREERWGRLAVAASKQCLRSHFLEISPPVQLDALLREAAADDASNGATCGVFAAHQSGLPLMSLENRGAFEEILVTPGAKRTGLLIIGPEGDFSQRELRLMEESGVRMVGLGDLRLRVETAALALLSGMRMMEQGSF